MGYVIFILTACINFIYGAVKKKNKILYGFTLVLVFLLMTFNFEGPDIGVYRLAYEIVRETPSKAFEATYMEWGYTALMVLSNKIGLDFFAFRIILSFVCLWLFCSTVKHFNANGNLIIGLYMLYLFFFDTIQLRNCIAQFIVLFSTRFLFKKSWRGTFSYIFCVLIAASIHAISFVYLSFVLIKFARKETYFKNILIFSAILFLICLFAKPVLPEIVNVVIEFIGHGSSYLHGTVSYGFWIVIALHLIGIVPLYLFRNGVKNLQVRNNINKIMYVNIILCLLLPLTLLNNNFNRIFRNNILLTQIGLALMYSNSSKRSSTTQAAMTSLILLNVGWCFSDFMRYEFANIVVPIIEKNLIFTIENSGNFSQYFIVTALCLLVIWIINKLSNYKSKSNSVCQSKRQNNAYFNNDVHI